MDLAASIQAVTEEVVLRLTRALARGDRRSSNLCLAGGVALNCVANGKVLRDGTFERHLDPAGGGRCRRRARRGARGLPSARRAAARRAERRRRACAAPISGPAFAQDEIERAPARAPARASTSLDDDDADRATARRRSPTGKAVGWFQGRMEFGPRALGARSILGDRALADDAEDAQPQGQIPRVLPPVRAVGAARGRRRLVRARRRQPLHAAGRRRRATSAAAR